MSQAFYHYKTRSAGLTPVALDGDYELKDEPQISGLDDQPANDAEQMSRLYQQEAIAIAERAGDMTNTDIRDQVQRTIRDYRHDSYWLLGCATALIGIILTAVIWCFTHFDASAISSMFLSDKPLSADAIKPEYMFYCYIASKAVVLAVLLIVLSLVIKIYKSKLHLIAILEHDCRILGMLKMLKLAAGNSHEKVILQITHILCQRPEIGILSTKGISLINHSLLKDE